MFALRGFDQDISTRKENKNTVKTIFTFGLQVEASRLPFLIDDLDNDWLQKKAEELKGATDGVKFMARGLRTLEQRVWKMYGIPIFTMNAVPDIPLALSDRIIISHYTEEHSKRQGKGKFEKLANSLKTGFLLNIVNETLAGKTIMGILTNVHYSVKEDAEINSRLITYAEELISDLYRRYDMEPLSTGLQLESTEQTLSEKVFTYVYTQIRKQDPYNAIGPKFCQIHGKILITSVGFEEIGKYYGWRNRNMTDFVNEMKGEGFKVKTVHNPCLGKKAWCIIMPDIEEPLLPEPVELNLETTEVDERDDYSSDPNSI